MAIRILNIGASDGVLSISYNRGMRGDSGRLIVKKIGQASSSSIGTSSSSIGGFNIGGGWKLISQMTGKESGGETTTLEYIDGSHILDKKNIVLFKRSISGVDAEYNATKIVKIPVISFSFNQDSGSGSFSITTEDRNITVKRKMSTGNPPGILGKEEWASNPCEPSAVYYDCVDALALIGVDNVAGISGKCSFEGSYRSVLSNIAAKFGKMWYWDNLSGKPKFFENTDVSLPEEPEDCNVYSSASGQTLDGARSIASWTYKRIKVANRQAKRTVEVYEYPTTNSVLHPDYPSAEEMTEDSVPNWKEYKAYSAATGFNYGPLRALGYQVIADYTMIFAVDWSAIIALGHFGINVTDFCQTFGIPVSRQFGFSNLPFLGGGTLIPETDFRSTVYSLMGVQEGYNSGGGTSFVKIVGGYSIKMYEKEKNTEIFYPAPKLNSHSFSGSSTAWKTVDIEVEPSPQRRGLSETDPEGLEGIGTWRGSSVDIRDNPGATGSGSGAWGAATEGALKPLNPEVLRYIIDGPFNFRNKRGHFQAALNNGFQVWASVPTPGVITVKGGGCGTNRNDLTSTADYKDPNALPPVVTPEQEESEDKAKEYDDPCEDLIQKELDESEEGLDEPIIIGNKDRTPGILGSSGGGFSASARGGGENASF